MASEDVKTNPSQIGCEALDLGELRARTGRTQAEVAERMGTSQSAVSRLERQDDVLVSTLRAFVRATGGDLRVLASYEGATFEIRNPARAREGSSAVRRAFDVIWQNQHTRQFVKVGRLEVRADDFTFSYSPDAHLHDDFRPFAPFPDLRTAYSSRHLFPFFADRVAMTAQNGKVDPYAALGLTGKTATPVELLALSWGTSPHDTIQIVPEPSVFPDGREARKFLVSGARHVDHANPDSVSRRIERLRPDQPLQLRDEPGNPKNPRAIALDARKRPVGWLPDYLVDDIHKRRDGGATINVIVERANGPNVPWHLRLLCRLEVG